MVATLLLGAAHTIAGEKRGRITEPSGEGIADVLVTDGYSFVRSGKDGEFVIDAKKGAEFLSVVTPADYEPLTKGDVPRFYAPISDKSEGYNITLRRSDSKSAYVVAIADPQMANQKHLQRYKTELESDLARKIAELKGTGRRVVGITLGDICWDNFVLMYAYQESVASMGVPFYGVIGNHDHNQHSKGDAATAKEYRAYYGTPDYIFILDRVHFIVLDNVIYDTAKNYKAGLTSKQLRWIESYVELMPEGDAIVFAQHIPPSLLGDDMKGLDKLLDIAKGHPTSFLTGHTHRNRNPMVTDGVIDYNVGSICGTWWMGYNGVDGAPMGCRVFDIDGAQLSNTFYTFNRPDNYQMELYNLGEYATQPNAVVAKVWNVHPDWRVEWSEDGVAKGEMEHFIAIDPTLSRYIYEHYTLKGKAPSWFRQPRESELFFKAEPSPRAKSVKVMVTTSDGEVYTQTLELNTIDVQAHRGGMALMPENTIPAMRNALDLGVNTLELDLNMSQDGYVVVSHDPYMNPAFALTPAGEEIAKEDRYEHTLYKMPYSTIRQYDVGSKQNARFPNQKSVKTYKPLASELIDSMESYALKMGYSAPRYNIEIKSSAKKDGTLTPPYKEFVDAAIAVLDSKGLGDRLIVQSFDVRALNYMHEKYPHLRLSYLVDKGCEDLVEAMHLIDFTAEWCSPHYSLLDADVVANFKAQGVKLAPWTVDESEDLQRMVDLDVEAIITNYPDRLIKILRKY